ncbi:hypothetical protein PABG_12203 [Paracoccidioides brasiliensis Pb03]|uniref:Uncharacterized protein n=1 Tax=Paracoccidioides brasiliensis TaxID=121759 RepID=A0A1D2JA65_PARBR|nr:hypothetical protein PABG_12203 [Paracoccidioides brasiliensis Pb03]ODH22390.1 hypothetical protein ACO22_05520 [Paracoccidioides brasiliensis]
MQYFASADGPREVNNHHGNHAVWLQYVERVRTWSTILGLMPEAETTLDRNSGGDLRITNFLANDSRTIRTMDDSQISLYQVKPLQRYSFDGGTGRRYDWSKYQFSTPNNHQLQPKPLSQIHRPRELQPLI